MKVNDGSDLSGSAPALSDSSPHKTRSPPVGILSSVAGGRRCAKKVDFNDEPQIMGYGGELVDIDEQLDEDCQDGSDIVNDESLTEQEKTILYETKCNTVFNSISSNLLAETRTMAEFVGQHDKVTERSVLTGCHKRYTPVFSIGPFGGSSSSVKVNPVAPMKNGEVISEKRVRKEMVEMKASKASDNCHMPQKITRLDEVIDEKLSSSQVLTGSEPSEPVVVKEVNKVIGPGKSCSKTQPESLPNFSISSKCNKKYTEPSVVSQSKAVGYNNAPLNDCERLPSKTKQHSTGANVGASKNDSSAESFEKNSESHIILELQSENDKAESNEINKTKETSLMNKLNTKEKDGLYQKSSSYSQSASISRTVTTINEVCESQNKIADAFSKAEGNENDKIGSASETSYSSLANNNSDSVFTPTSDTSKTSLKDSICLPRNSFLHTNAIPVQKSVISKSNASEVQDVANVDRLTREYQNQSTAMISNRVTSNFVTSVSPRDKPKIPVKPPGLNKFSRSLSNEKADNANADVGMKKNDPLSVIPSPTVTHSGSDDNLFVDNKDIMIESESLDPSSRLTKLLEGVTKSSVESISESHSTPDPPSVPAELRMFRTEEIMRRERKLERLREDSLRNQHSGCAQSDNSSYEPLVCDDSPIPPIRSLKKRSQPDTTLDDTQEQNSESCNQSDSVVAGVSTSMTPEINALPSVDPQNVAVSGVQSIQDEIVKLISDAFSDPIDSFSSNSEYPVDPSLDRSIDMLERKRSEPDDEDGVDDPSLSRSMRTLSVSPVSRRRGPAVKFASETKNYTRQIKPRAQSMPRSECLQSSDRREHSRDRSERPIEGGGERRSRRDDQSRRHGKFSIIKLLKFGAKDEKKKRTKPVDVIRYKPQIIHPIDLAPAGPVEVVVRTDEEKRRDEEERERKRALFFSEGINVYESPTFNKIPNGQRSSALSTPNQLGYNSAGKPKPPPPPRRISSVISSDSVTSGNSSNRPSPPPSSQHVLSRPIDTSTPVSHSAQYANLGVARSDLTPHKPGRLGSSHHGSTRCAAAVDKQSNEARQGGNSEAEKSGSMSLPSFTSSTEDGGAPDSLSCGPAKESSDSLDNRDSLERSYEAVTSSNHQALRQLLEQ